MQPWIYRIGARCTVIPLGTVRPPYTTTHRFCEALRGTFCEGGGTPGRLGEGRNTAPEPRRPGWLLVRPGEDGGKAAAEIASSMRKRLILQATPLVCGASSMPACPAQACIYGGRKPSPPATQRLALKPRPEEAVRGVPRLKHRASAAFEPKRASNEPRSARRAAQLTRPWPAFVRCRRRSTRSDPSRQSRHHSSITSTGTEHA
jgi:hypothetical protein